MPRSASWRSWLLGGKQGPWRRLWVAPACWAVHLGLYCPCVFMKALVGHLFWERGVLGYVEPVCIKATATESVLRLLPIMHGRRGGIDDFSVFVPHMKPHAF